MWLYAIIRSVGFTRGHRAGRRRVLETVIEMGTTVGDLKQQVERTTGIAGLEGRYQSLLIYVDMLLIC